MNEQIFNEPLMSFTDWRNLMNFGVNDNRCQQYANYHTKWHLNNVKEVVCEVAKTKSKVLEFDRINVEVDKQSITNAFESYIKDNIK